MQQQKTTRKKHVITGSVFHTNILKNTTHSSLCNSYQFTKCIATRLTRARFLLTAHIFTQNYNAVILTSKQTIPSVREEMETRSMHLLLVRPLFHPYLWRLLPHKKECKLIHCFSEYRIPKVQRSLQLLRGRSSAKFGNQTHLQWQVSSNQFALTITKWVAVVLTGVFWFSTLLNCAALRFSNFVHI